jgi:hypothetical protein
MTPSVAPETPEQIRVAHNVAVSRGGEPDLRALGLSPPHVRFDDGTELLGVRFDDGARPLLTLYYRAAGPSRLDVMPSVRGHIERGPAWSTTMADRVVREVAPPLAIATRRWKPGYVYSQPIEIRRRPGRERFELRFEARDWPLGVPPPKLPETTDGRVVVVLTL